jgi:hypothetical protein
MQTRNKPKNNISHFYHSDGDEHESLRHDVLREFVRGKAGPNGWQGLEIMLS